MKETKQRHYIPRQAISPEQTDAILVRERTRTLTNAQQVLAEQTGFISTRDTRQTIVLTRDDMPWISDEQVVVHIAEGELVSGEKVLFGSAIRGKALRDELKGMDADTSTKLVSGTIGRILARDRSLHTVDNPSTDHIVYAPTSSEATSAQRRNQSGTEKLPRRAETVFIMKVDREQEKPVFVRVAAGSGVNEKPIQKILMKQPYSGRKRARY